MSVTVTVNEQVAVFPEPSVAKNALVVMPTGKVAPLASPVVRVTGKEGAQLSAATTVL